MSCAVHGYGSSEVFCPQAELSIVQGIGGLIRLLGEHAKDDTRSRDIEQREAHGEAKLQRAEPTSSHPLISINR
jgi:hypothetical protein